MNAWKKYSGRIVTVSRSLLVPCDGYVIFLAYALCKEVCGYDHKDGTRREYGEVETAPSAKHQESLSLPKAVGVTLKERGERKEEEKEKYSLSSSSPRKKQNLFLIYAYMHANTQGMKGIMETSVGKWQSIHNNAASAGDRPALASWRLTGIGVLRMVFGLVWGIDAWFKWQPDFVNNFTSYLSSDGQPGWIASWINFWVNMVKVDPHLFAYAVAIGETAVALALIVGAFSNVAYLGGVLLSIVIWTTAEGFGGPYVAGATDVGAAIIYVLVFAGLFLSNAGLYLGLDQRLTPLLGRVGWLASGIFKRRQE